MFSIKTQYSFVEDTGEEALVVNRPLPTCQVKQLNVVHRHGHRFSSKKYIMKFKELSKKINWKRAANNNSDGDDGDILGLPWDPPLDEEHKSHLTEVGQRELYRIGVRMRRRFPELFTKRYNARRFKFISTNKIRTTHSASSLAAGLFDGDGSIHSRIQPIALETTSSDCRILRSYDNCQVYKREIENNPDALLEYHRFLESDHMKRVALKVETKLNLDVPKIKLTHHDLDAIFIGCAYEMSMFFGSFDKGLCSLLDENDRLILEYAEDLENFYLSGNPLNPLTYRIACPLLKDIIKNMKEAVEGKSILQGIFRSAHSTAVLMLFTLLGLNQQHSPLTSNNFEEQMKNNERFRSSTVSPFAANVNFVLYNCGDGRLKIQLYWNERLQRLPCCRSDVDCDFDDFLDYFQKQIDQCDSEDLCKKKDEDAQQIFPRTDDQMSMRNSRETLLTTDEDMVEENEQSSFFIKLLAFISFLFTILKTFMVNWVGRTLNRLYPKQE